ncbi:hypothetical protein Syun_017343 [Stephania yunnanensis]|uniref:Uncharacterized protein n=1 Tax=Stephania yunnanensis TaxID=152371 RepID=A0AAP0P5R3_9MAGN
MFVVAAIEATTRSSGLPSPSAGDWSQTWCAHCFQGHNIEKVRERMRELTKQIVRWYSAGKLFPYILEGLRSKNNRTQIECVDLIGFLIDNHGAEVTVVTRNLLLA